MFSAYEQLNLFKLTQKHNPVELRTMKSSILILNYLSCVAILIVLNLNFVSLSTKSEENFLKIISNQIHEENDGDNYNYTEKEKRALSLLNEAYMDVNRFDLDESIRTSFADDREKRSFITNTITKVFEAIGINDVSTYAIQ